MTKQEADNYLKQYVKEKSGHTMRASEISDFSLTGEEDERDIEQWADDYISDCETDMAEYRATAQDRYNDQNEYAIVQSERYEMFRNEF